MANSIPELTQISTVLSRLAHNYSEMARNWHDVFYSTEPADIDIQFYDEQGILYTTTIPNRAKDFRLILNGEGSPENIVAAGKGSLYQDTLNGKIYLKNSVSGTSEVSKDGWVELVLTKDIFTGTGSPIGVQPGKKGNLYVDISITPEGKSKAELYVNTSNSEQGSSEAWVKISGDDGGIDDFKYVHTTGDEEIDGEKTFLQNTLIKREKQAFTVYESESNNSKLQVGISSSAEKGVYNTDKDQWLIKVDNIKNSLSTDCTLPAVNENSNSIVTTAWVRKATGKTNLDAASAIKDGEGNNIADTYQKKLIAGKGIIIKNNTISSEGGVDMTYDAETETLLFS